MDLHYSPESKLMLLPYKENNFLRFEPYKLKKVYAASFGIPQGWPYKGLLYKQYYPREYYLDDSFW